MAAKYQKSRGPRPEHTVATGFYVIVDTQMSLTKAFLTFETILLCVSFYLRISTSFLFVHIMCTQRHEFLLVHLLRTERMFTMAWIFAGVVRVDISNKTAKRAVRY